MGVGAGERIEAGEGAKEWIETGEGAGNRDNGRGRRVDRSIEAVEEAGKRD